MDLSTILTAELYRKVLDIQFPFDVPVDMGFASKYYFKGEPDNTRDVRDACYESALPDPDSKNYPEHTLALILLLDQGPRTLFKGMNYRYTFMFFDVTSRMLVKELIARGAFPDSIDQWTALGYPFEDAMVRKFWLYGPLIHSEDLDDHRA